MSEIQSITNRQRAMMRDLVLNGISQKECSEKYDVTEQHLSVIVNSPLWKKEAAIMHDNAVGEYKSQMLTLIPKALKNVNEIMERETIYDIIDQNTGESKQIHVTNPPACRLKASELVLANAGLDGKNKLGDGSRSIVMQLVQPAWGNEEGKATAISVEVNG